MFQVAISYFYQIRYFRPYMIPVSTAVWDPKWYHEFYGSDHCFIDKNHVINGLRMPCLVPGDTCKGLCSGLIECQSRNPAECDFLKAYRKQLEGIPFDAFIANLEKNAVLLTNKLHLLQEPLYVFIVYEKYDNPCSERAALLDWFRSHGLDANELQYPIRDFY